MIQKQTREIIANLVEYWWINTLKEQKHYGGYLPINDGEFFIFENYKIDFDSNLIIVEGLYQDEDRMNSDHWVKALLYYKIPDNWDGSDEELIQLGVELEEDIEDDGF